MSVSSTLSLSTLYLVMGCSGSYEDRSEWVVACVEDAGAAATLRDQAHREAQAEIRRRRDDGGDDESNFMCATPFDLAMRVVDGHVHYRVAPALMCAGSVQGRGLLDGIAQMNAARDGLGMPDEGSLEQRSGEVRGAFAEKLRHALMSAAH